jgi:diacylglycerol O-acyltransferase / wax synthase
MDHMSALDSTFLHAEDGLTHMHIGSCAIFDGPSPAFDDVLALIAGKLAQIARYRQKVRFVPAGLGRPAWVDDAAFDLTYHVRHTALPAPASVTDLDTVVGRVMSQELDRHRPLWEAWMIDGLPDDRWALVSKVHHCMVDGVSGADLITTLLDDRADAVRHEPDTWDPAPEPTDAMLVAESMGRLFVHRPAARRGLQPLVPTPARAAAHVRTTLAGLRSFGRLTTMPPASAIQGGIGPHRRWSAANASLTELRTIKRAFGGTVNDVVLAVIAGAFRELLEDLGEDPDHAVLRALVPVSVRSDEDGAPNNQVTAMIAELPVGMSDPLERLTSMRDQMEHLKASGQADATQMLTTLAGLTAPSVLALALRAATLIGRHVPQRSIGTVTTNVRGPDHTLYAAGRKMVAYQPFVPIAQGVRIGVAILSYDDHVSFGVTGDYDTVPDVARLCRSIESGIGDLHDQAGRSSTSRT